MQTGESPVVTRARIVEVARTYVGTKFHHQGRLKGVALDCVGLVLCVAEDLGLVDRAGRPILRSDHLDYGPEPASTLVHDLCVERLEQKPAIAKLEAGDVLSVRVPSLPCHLAIVAYRGVEPYLIHAYSAGPQQCIEHVFNQAWERRIIGKFFFPGVTG